jgi:hypothetical protein
MCVIREQSVSFPKKCKLSLHYETKHSDLNQQLSGECRKKRSFSISDTENPTKYIWKRYSLEQASKVSFEIYQLNVKSSRPFNGGKSRFKDIVIVGIK